MKKIVYFFGTELKNRAKDYASNLCNIYIYIYEITSFALQI